MKVRFLLLAQLELEEIVDYYNFQKDGLGFIFLRKFKKQSVGLFSTLKHGPCSLREQEDAKQSVSLMVLFIM